MLIKLCKPGNSPNQPGRILQNEYTLKKFDTYFGNVITFTLKLFVQRLSFAGFSCFHFELHSISFLIDQLTLNLPSPIPL